MTVVEELVVRILGDNQDLQDKLAESGSSIEDFASGIDAGMKKAAKAAALVGAAVVAIGGLAVRAAMDFETAWVGVLQNVNDTEENLANLRQGIRDMAKDTGFAATELAGVAEAAGELGLAAGPAEAFTRTVADFARATGEDLETAKTALEEYVRTARVAPDDVRPLTSAAVALSSALGGQEDQLLGIAASLDATLTSAGIAKPAILGVAGALNSLGIDAGRGSAAIKSLVGDLASAVTNGDGLGAFEERVGASAQAILDLAEKGPAGEAAIKRLATKLNTTSKSLLEQAKAAQEGGGKLAKFAQVAGMSADEFTTLFQKDATAALAAFLSGLNKLQQQGGPAALSALDGLGLGGAGVADTLLRAASGADRFTEAIAIANGEMASGAALAEEASIAYDSPAVKLQKLQQRATDLGISIGANLMPAFVGLLGTLAPIADWLGKHSKLTTALLVAVGGLAAVVLAVNLALKVYAAIQVIIRAATIAWTAVQWLLNAALTANPIGLIIVAVAALVAAIIWVVEKTVGWANVADWLMSAWSAVVDFFAGLWEGVKAVVGAAVDFLVNLFLNFTPLGLIIKHWDTLVEFFSGLWDNVKAVFSGLVDWFLGIGRAIVDGFLNGLKNAWSAVTDWTSNAVDGVKDFFTSGFGIFSPSKVFLEYGHNIVAGLANGMKGLSDAMTGPIDDAKTAAEVSFQTTAQVVGGPAAAIAQSAAAAATPPTPVQSDQRPSESGRAIYLTIERIEVPIQQAGGNLDLTRIGDALRTQLGDVLRSVLPG